jgi:hypothetical protein
MFSINKFIVEAYTGDRSLRANTTSGFAMIENRTALQALKTVADAEVVVGEFRSFVPKGSTVFIQESKFFEPGWAQKVFTSEGIEGNFIIVHINDVEFINRLEAI